MAILTLKFPTCGSKRQLILLLSLFYVSGIYIFCSTSRKLDIYNSSNSDVEKDREALLGKFLLEEKSSNFSFESFKRHVVASLSKDDFRVTLYPDVFELKDVSIKKFYFEIDGTKMWCFKDGSDITLSLQEKRCVCKTSKASSPLYFGDDCGVPAVLWNSFETPESRVTFKRRQSPRRLIHALPMNHEFDLFETRMSLQYDVVDMFMVGESNRTNSGGIKEPYFLLRFAAGWLKQWQDKLLYVFQGHFPEEGYEDGFIADGYMRRHLTREGFKRTVGVRPDDLFIYTDGDELIEPEVLTFLKLYDGFSEPVAFKYKWSIYGFYWQIEDDHFGQHKTPEPAAMTVRFFRDFYRFDSSHVRTHDFEKMHKQLGDYHAANRSVGIWPIYGGGWHCSWCFGPEGIRKKLLDAPKSDYPRFGDDVAKTTVDYIKRLIKHGLYFNLESFRKSGQEITPMEDPEMAPKYVLDHADRMSYLLKNPFKNVTFERVKFQRSDRHDQVEMPI